MRSTHNRRVDLWRNARVFCSTCTMSSYRKFTFAISSPDEFLVLLVGQRSFAFYGLSTALRAGASITLRSACDDPSGGRRPSEIPQLDLRDNSLSLNMLGRQLKAYIFGQWWTQFSVNSTANGELCLCTAWNDYSERIWMAMWLTKHSVLNVKELTETVDGGLSTTK